jgi:hypothetical protein
LVEYQILLQLLALQWTFRLTNLVKAFCARSAQQ